ncbi:hypothetical protein MC885_013351 [Smutsia gigantea]|nr:hypothetical protein MC885_013351 [Smutsia gigantea]
MAMNYNAKDEVDGRLLWRPEEPQAGRHSLQTATVGGLVSHPDGGTVLPTFFIVGLIFIPIGIGIFVTSNNTREIEIDYTRTDPSSPCTKYLSANVTPCICTVNFTLKQSFEGNAFMYYGLISIKTIVVM